MATKGSNVDMKNLGEYVHCLSQMIYRFNGVWEGPDPTIPIVPLFLVQLTLCTFATAIFAALGKLVRQPRFAGEILAGIILGPSVLGISKGYRTFFFPIKSFEVIETFGHYALVYYGLLCGVKTDIKALERVSPSAVQIAIGGAIVPFSIGMGLYWGIKGTFDVGVMYYGLALCVTGYPVLNKILLKNRLEYTDVGRLAKETALVSEFMAWIFLTIGLPVATSRSLLSVVFTAMLAAASYLFLGKFLSWIMSKLPENHEINEFYIGAVVAGAGLYGVFADICGAHPMVGSFLFGLFLPSRPLQTAIVHRLHVFVMRLLMPVFYVVAGLRVNIFLGPEDSTNGQKTAIAIGIVVACFAKIIGNLVVSIVLRVTTIEEALALGVLANTKGVLAIAVLEMGQVQRLLCTTSYSIAVIACLLMTVVVAPIQMLFYRTSKDRMPYRRRTIQNAGRDEELRVVCCLHDTHDITPTISLLESANPSTTCPISVFALQLVELDGRSSASVVVHNSKKAARSRIGRQEKTPSTNQIIHAFDNFELRSVGVNTLTLTATCAYASMDDEICSVAKERKASFIILPFHKRKIGGDSMEEFNPEIQCLNENVLAQAPCSVGILIDYGLPMDSDIEHARNVVMLYFGGPDDREALFLAWRISENPEIRLQVVRFVHSKNGKLVVDRPIDYSTSGFVSIDAVAEREKMLDDDFINHFKIAKANDPTVSYVDLVLEDEEQTITAIKSMDRHYYDLYIVGKGRGVISPLTASLLDWCDCPELGPIGDLLVSSEFTSQFSVLVVQQFNKAFKHNESAESESTVSQQDMDYDGDH